METPTKLFSAVLGLTAFVVSVAAGLFAGAAGPDVLARAIVSMLVCYVVGALLGWVAGYAIRDFVAGYHRAHPITDLKAVAAEYDAPSDTGSGAASS